MRPFIENMSKIFVLSKYLITTNQYITLFHNNISYSKQSGVRCYKCSPIRPIFSSFHFSCFLATTEREESILTKYLGNLVRII